MGFFGKIGVDWSLILAQAVNFGILLWVLRRFAYEPLLKGMAESDLERAESRMAAVKQAESDAAAERQRLLGEAKQSASKMVEQAEQIAAQIKERVKQEAAAERQKLLAHLEKQAAAQEEAHTASLAAAAMDEAIVRLSDNLQRFLEANQEVARCLQSAFADEVAAALAELSPDDLDRNDHHLRLAWGLGTAEQDLTKRADKLIKTALEHLPFRPDDDFVPASGQAAELIAGYRLEISGRVIDRSLKETIIHALKR
jgi:F0F1-type ATP synthase membrane subunit b/b'